MLKITSAWAGFTGFLNQIIFKFAGSNLVHYRRISEIKKSALGEGSTMNFGEYGD
jgi:hypothetical protein